MVYGLIIILLSNQIAMTNAYQLDVNLKDIATGTDAFSESYRVVMWRDFVENKQPKDHCFKNHVEGFVTLLRKNLLPLTKNNYKKWDIYVVSYGMNVGSEINGERPSIVYKANGNTLGDDIIVIPLTSALQEKQSDKFDTFIQKDEANKLFQNSYARLRQVRSVSTKRIGKIVGSITNPEAIDAITKWMADMFGE